MFSSESRRYLYVFVIFFSISLNVTAQTLTNIPPNEPNTRFSSQDVFASKIVRPALSVRGFDSSTLPGGANIGLGMKQILEKLIADDPSVVDVIDELNNTNDIVGQADMDLVTPPAA